MASRYLVGGGTGNWNSTTNWAATDGGASGASFPIAGDDVNFTSNSGATGITVNVASACATMTSTGTYSGVITMTSTLTTTGTWTFPVGSFTGTGDIITVTGSTFNITPTLSGGLRLGGTSQTYTLSRALTMTGTLTMNGTTGTTFSGNFLITAGACTISATVMAFVMSGNITVTGLTTFSGATSCTFTGAKAFQTATCDVTGGLTLTITNIGSMTVTGLTTSKTTANVFTGGTWNTQGLTTSIATTGSTLFNITGGGTITLTAVCSNSITIAGDTTWASATNLYSASGTPTLTYSSGTITVGTSTLSIASACTIVPGTEKFLYNLTLTAAITLTINTNVLTLGGTFTAPDAAITLAGTAGLTAPTWTNTLITAARTYTLTQGNTYKVTTAFSPILPTAAAGTIRYLTMVSSHATNQVIFTVVPEATQSVAFVIATRIDSSLGQQIFDYNGTLTTTTNWTTSYRNPYSGFFIQ